MNTNTETKQIKICMWNVWLGILQKIQLVNLELKKTSQTYSRRTLIYIRERLNYERMSQFEEEDAHVICIRMPAKNICIASKYQTNKLTHKNNHISAIEEQISVLNCFMSMGMDTVILGGINLNYKKKNDYSYHLRKIYDEWTKIEQEHQLV